VDDGLLGVWSFGMFAVCRRPKQSWPSWGHKPPAAAIKKKRGPSIDGLLGKNLHGRFAQGLASVFEPRSFAGERFKQERKNTSTPGGPVMNVFFSLGLWPNPAVP